MARRFFGLMFAILTATLVVGHAQERRPSSADAPKSASYDYSVLYDFSAPPNPATAQGSLIQGSDGNYYGAANGGGANDPEVCSGDFGCGAIFKLTPSGTLSILYSFCSQADCADGFGPAGLIEAGDGNFYGITGNGGNTNSNCPNGAYGCGTVFKLTPAGVLTTLYAFCQKANCTDGETPVGGLIEGSDGSFYGLTAWGGANQLAQCASTDDVGCGTVFKVTSSGDFTSLYSFCSKAECADGANPNGALLQGSDGYFYGANGGAHYEGALFKVNAIGSLTTLYAFCSQTNCTDGNEPSGSLVEGKDGSLYGTATGGGTNTDECFDGSSCGTVYSVTTSGSLTTLYSFCSQAKCADGENPAGDPLYLASDGNFYGSTLAGGSNESSCLDDECGTVFQITPSGALTTLYSFCSQPDCTDGYYESFVSLMQGSTGNFYGYADAGGTDPHSGILYELSPSPALPAPVQLTFSDSTVNAGNSVTLDWSVLNAFSTTMQQCYAFVQGGATGAGAWTGLQTGALANNIYSGSATITPTAAGTYTYALTCGGIESGFATLTVDASETADLTFTSVTHNLGSVQVGSSTSGVSNYGVKITNTSGAAISATGISLTGSNEFKYQTNCPAKLAAGAYCEVLFTFAPTSTGTVTASWSIAGLPEGTTFNPSNGGTLTGTGVPANGLNLTTSVHNFGSVTVGTSSPVYGTVLTNSYSFPVTLTYTTSGSTASFPLVTNCGAVLYAGESCNSNFTFTPKATGFVTETIGVTASYNGNPIAVTSLGQTVTGFTLKGTGQ